MPILVTRTKVVLPRRRPDLLTRQRLVDMLFELMDYKLVIVAAPAGYGKTSLLIDFAHLADIATCWYSLDRLDQDTPRFLAHFLAAIAERFPKFGKQSLAALELGMQAKLDLDNLVATIVNEAFEHIREHFILVIDDYHLVDDQREINYFISRFTQEVDENCHIILASRALLALPDMPLLVARSMVGGLSFEELTFQPDEIQSLLMQNYNIAIPKSSAEELSFSTEGWITGLLLSTHHLNQELPDRLRIARLSRVHLYDYLAHQVLDQLPTEIRSFLLRSSILEEFDSHLCEEVLGSDEDYPYVFDYILKNNLFVLPVGDQGQWLRYHHLFREFLQARLTEENPPEKEKILRRLVETYSTRGEWEQALAICTDLKDASLKIDLIVLAGPSMIRNSRLALLAEWIDALPVELFQNNPALLTLRSVPETVLGSAERALEMLNKAVPLFRDKAAKVGLAQALAQRATVLRTLGKYWEALQDATEAQTLINDEPTLQTNLADALRGAGISLYQLGQVKQAINTLVKALNIYNSLGEKQNYAVVLMDLGLMFVGLGQFNHALSYYDQALEYWKEVNNTVRQANLLNNLGVLRQLTGDYESAASTFEQALKLARLNRYTRMEAYTLASIGDLYADLEANKAALEAYQHAKDLAQTIDYRFLIFYSELAMGARYRALGRLDDAQQYFGSVGSRLNDNSSTYELGLYEQEQGRLNLARGKLIEGTDCLERAVEHLADAGQIVEIARARLFCAYANFLAGDTQRARHQLAMALELSQTMDSQHVLVTGGIETKDLIKSAVKDLELTQPASSLLQKITHFESAIPSLRKKIRSHSTSIPFAPPKLVIRALGRTQVERDGNIVNEQEWQNQRKVRELFFYLLSQPNGMTKEEIGVVFWPESSNAQLKLQFKNTIYRLRHALGPDVVLFEDEFYRFNRTLDYEYDVERFQELISQAQACPEIAEQVNTFSAAIELYKGPFLPDAEGHWIITERELLHDNYLQATSRMAHFHFEQRDYNAALEYCQYALDEDPCLEEIHRLAMQIYAIRGNRANVIRQYERCKMALKTAINAMPSPQTTSMYEESMRSTI